MGIELPSGFATEIASSTNTNLVGLSPYITLVLSVLLAAVVVTVLVRAISGRH